MVAEPGDDAPTRWRPTRVVTVCDREGDLYELLSLARSEEREFLIRAAQNQQTMSGEVEDDRAVLFGRVEASAIQGSFSLALQRTPVVSVRSTQLWLRPPEPLKHLPAIAVTVILAEEMQPSIAETPIRSLLRRDVGGAWSDCSSKHIQSISGHKSLSGLQRCVDVTQKNKEMAIATLSCRSS